MAVKSASLPFGNVDVYKLHEGKKEVGKSEKCRCISKETVYLRKSEISIFFIRQYMRARYHQIRDSASRFSRNFAAKHEAGHAHAQQNQWLSR